MIEQINTLNAEQLANKVLNEIKKREGKIVFPIDPFKLLKDNNIIVTFSNFEKLEGIILNDETDTTIVSINRLRPWTRQRFSAAHEYCHFIKDLKQGINEINTIECLTNSKSAIEKYADNFAAYLLMPNNKLKELCAKYKNDKGYIDFEKVTIIAEYFGISFTSCINRIAYELKMIDGNIDPKELKKRIRKYKPETKRKELIKKNNDIKLLGNMINNMSYCMIDLNKNTGIKFLNNYIYYDNKLEGVIQKDVPYIIADLNYNKEKSIFLKTNDEKIIMTLGNYKLQEYVLTTADNVSIKLCLKMHRILHSYTAYPEYAGVYRNTNAMIKSGTIQPPDYLTISNKIIELDRELQSFLLKSNSLPIDEYIRKASYFTYKFIVIHPFSDGNGRISRALFNWLLKHRGIPPIYIDDDSREEYYNALSQIDLHGDYDKFVILVEKRIINTMIELHNYLFIEE